MDLHRPLCGLDNLIFCGHQLDVVDDDRSSSKSDSTTSLQSKEESAASKDMREEDSPFYPTSVYGSFTLQTNHGQAFASTDTVLTQGMCGGAVLKPNLVDCVGMIEGIVPEGGPDALKHQAAFIPASELNHLVQNILAHEEDSVEMVQFGSGLVNLI